MYKKTMSHKMTDYIIWQDNDVAFINSNNNVIANYKGTEYPLFDNIFDDLDIPSIDDLLILFNNALNKLTISTHPIGLHRVFVVELHLHFDSYFSSDTRETPFGNSVSNLELYDHHEGIFINSYKGTSILLTDNHDMEKLINDVSNMNSFEFFKLLEEKKTSSVF